LEINCLLFVFSIFAFGTRVREVVDPEKSHIHLYFRGRTEPYNISAAEIGDATEFVVSLLRKVKQ
jgi:hypothetical protein